MKITGTQFDGVEVGLTCQDTGRVIHHGEYRKTRRDGYVKVLRGRPPHKSSSSGSAYCENSEGETFEVFAGVVDCSWRPLV